MSTPKSQLHAALAWLSILVPIVPVLLALRFELPPPSLRAHSIDLTGVFQIHEGHDPAFASPDYDDKNWPTIKIPGPYKKQGFSAPECWMRKTFYLPESLREKDLFLWLGATRSQMAAVYLNGRYLGRLESLSQSYQSQLNNNNGWEILRSDLRDGPNVLAIHFTWSALVDLAGIPDPRFLIGPVDEVKPFYKRLRAVESLNQYGTIAATGLLTSLLLVLLFLEWSSTERAKYIAAAMVTFSTLWDLITYKGLWHLVADVPFSVHLPLQRSSLMLLGLSMLEFYEYYYVRRATWVRKLNRLVCGVLILLTHLKPLSHVPLIVFSIYFCFIIVYIAALSIRGAVRRVSPAAPLLLSMTLCVVAGWTVETLMHRWVLHVPSVAHLVFANLGFVVSVVVILEFLQISRLNKALSVSLGETNQDLARALAQAQESTRLKGEFLATVSHELRTPLNTIVNVPDGLLRDFRDSVRARCGHCADVFELDTGERIDAETACPSCKQKGQLNVESGLHFVGNAMQTAGYLRSIKQAGTLLLHLVNDILDFSRLESGKMAFYFEQVSLSQLLSELETTLQPLAQARQISLEVAAVSPEATLRADPVKLLQIFVNLVSNAIKFSHQGGRVEIGVTDDGSAYVFRVRDEGIGIAPENHALIFESFRQVESGHTRSYGGSGLGLAITKELVLGHGGTVWVESEAGQGSTFFVRIPINADAGVVRALPKAFDAAKEDGRKTVLVIDDEPLVVETTKLALKELGLRVVGSTDGRQAARLCAELHPDLIILDVMMPKMSGLHILHELRGRAETKDVPVLVASAYHSNREIALSLQAVWIDKPWSARNFEDEVRRILNGTAKP